MTGATPADEGAAPGAFLRHRSLWLATERTDRAHLAALGATLARALESGTASPADVAARALGVCLLARGTAAAHEALPIAFTGLDAVDEGDGGEHAAQREALLAVCVAEIHAAADRRLDALGMLRRARGALERIEAPDAAAIHAALLMTRLDGELAEAGRDRMGAARAFAECAAHAASLLDRQASGADGLEGPLAGDVPGHLESAVLSDAVDARVAALLGRVRALVPAIGPGSGSAAAAAAAQEAMAAVEAHGVPASVQPLDVVETAVALAPREAAQFARTAARWAESAERVSRRDWEAALTAARAHGAALRADGVASAALHERAGAIADDDVSPEVAAFVRGLDLLDNADAEDELRGAIAEEFMIALSDLADAEAGAAGRPDARAAVLLEAPIAAAIEFVATHPHPEDGGSDARVRLGLLIDILREPRWQPVIPAMHTDPAETLSIAGQAWELSLDRPGRILGALRARPDEAVLVVQRLAGSTLFLSLQADGTIALDGAGPDYREALRGLAGASAGAAHGRAAFDALPAAVQVLLHTHRRVLIVPDPRVQDGALAFQRMHDGTGYLSGDRDLVHAASLREAMRTLEPAHDDVTRLIDVFADPAGDPTERLQRFERVRATLETDEADPRAAAALALTLAMTRLDECSPAEAEWAVDRLIATADELDHRPSGALLRAIRARELARQEAAEHRRLEAVDAALPWLDSMRPAGAPWERLHRELSAERETLALRVRILEESAHFPER